MTNHNKGLVYYATCFALIIAAGLGSTLIMSALGLNSAVWIILQYIGMFAFGWYTTALVNFLMGREKAHSSETTTKDSK